MKDNINKIKLLIFTLMRFDFMDNMKDNLNRMFLKGKITLIDPDFHFNYKFNLRF